jgi:growth hormone-inducible transmembrane protein
MYFGASIGISAASAVAVFRTPVLINLVSRSGWMSIIATFALVSEILNHPEVNNF